MKPTFALVPPHSYLIDMEDQALLEKLAAAGTPEEVSAALKDAGQKLVAAAPAGDKPPGKDGKPPGEKAPPFGKPKSDAGPPAPGGNPFSSPPDEPYGKARDRALKKSAKDEGMDF